MTRTARAYWLAEPGSGEIHSGILPDPGAGEVLVRSLVSGISRGTETLVFRGGVPESQYARAVRVTSAPSTSGVGS